jgi:hypothetical protein
VHHPVDVDRVVAILRHRQLIGPLIARQLLVLDGAFDADGDEHLRLVPDSLPAVHEGQGHIEILADGVVADSHVVSDRGPGRSVECHVVAVHHRCHSDRGPVCRPDQLVRCATDHAVTVREPREARRTSERCKFWCARERATNRSRPARGGDGIRIDPGDELGGGGIHTRVARVGDPAARLRDDDHAGT